MEYKIVKTKEGNLFNHKIRMEKELGREIKEDEVIHHINQNKTDDSIENLYLCERNGIHRSIHRQFYNLMRNLGLELLKKKVVEFDKEIGFYYFKKGIDIGVFKKIFDKINPILEDIELIKKRRKEIIKKPKIKKICFWDSSEGKLALKQIYEIDEKNSEI